MPGSSHPIRHFHVSFFATVMGMAGLALSWQAARPLLTAAAPVGLALAALSALLFLAVSGCYGLKLLRFQDQVRAELHHPIKLSFFPAFSISLVLLSMLALELSMPVSRVLWLVGATLHLALTVFIVTQWIYQTHFEIQHGTPAWFIPAVGNILMPIAGVPLGFVDASWFFFSIGLMFWIVLKVLVFNRIIFHDPFPAKLLPTLFILIAPPSVGFLAYLQLNGGQLNDFARILYFAAAFLALLLVSQARRFVRIEFSLSWWAYSFPFAAFSIASQRYFAATQSEFFRIVAYGSLALATLVIGMLAARTLAAVASGRAFLPD